MESVVASIDGRRLDGLRVVVDCANGAATAGRPEGPAGARRPRRGAPRRARRHEHQRRLRLDPPAGRSSAAVVQPAPTSGSPSTATPTGSSPSTPPVGSSTATRSSPSRAIDRKQRGRAHRRRRGRDRHDATSASASAWRPHGIDVVEAPVGDRHVLAALAERGLSLGGEQCGHVVFADLASTGDGLLTARAAARRGGPLRPAAGRARRRRHDPAAPGPAQRRVRPAPAPRSPPSSTPRSAAAEAELGAHGRVLLRPSGTEPLVRVMVEAPDATRPRPSPTGSPPGPAES